MSPKGCSLYRRGRALILPNALPPYHLGSRGGRMPLQRELSPIFFKEQAMIKKTFAMAAIAGMLTSPLALAQQDADQAQAAPAEPNVPAQAQTAPQAGGASGLAESLGISQTALTVGIGAAIAVGIGVAASGEIGRASW